MQSLSRIYLATSNPGKITDFKAIAGNLGVIVAPLSGFETLPQAIEDGATFEENARLKAEHYSRLSPGNLLVADDSGLVVEALHGAPGVHSARYAAVIKGEPASHLNSNDEENNRVVISQLEQLPPSQRSGKFVCVIAVAKDGATLQTFCDEVRGQMVTVPQGPYGFGYDPLFYFPQVGKTFGQLPPEEKARYSHRGKAFQAFLEWYKAQL